MLPWRFASFDLLELGLLTETDLIACINSALNHARPAVLRGGIETSLEKPGTELFYRLMDGHQVSQYLPALDALYRDQLVKLAKQVFDLPVCPSPMVQNGVNFNVLEDPRSRYEWHVDSNPITGLLSFTESDAETGGRLIFGQDPGKQVALPLRPGQFLVFDARRAPHSVEPLHRKITRVTAPMNFFIDGLPAERPAGLDDSLYGAN